MFPSQILCSPVLSIPKRQEGNIDRFMFVPHTCNFWIENKVLLYMRGAAVFYAFLTLLSGHKAGTLGVRTFIWDLPFLFW